MLFESAVKIMFCIALVVGGTIASNLVVQENQVTRTELALRQLDEPGGIEAQRQMVREHTLYTNGLVLMWISIGFICFFIFLGDIRRMLRVLMASCIAMTFLMSGTGCARKPFEPIKLEVIKSNEEAFLLPLTADGKKQTSSDNEEYLRSNLVYSKQVQLPQQWVAKGYETWGYNGEWRDAATLIKVDKSPETREWTADPNTGTSNRNEAVWVMTSDQVEFSTGWTVTARIANRDDAVKFLHNYPNGSLKTVMDTEVRSKLQAEFGLEVTDLPMDELRKNATPHILKVVKSITEFFKQRGITITNLGITGGFIYKDKSILDTMVKVFNAEQERSIAIARSNAQKEMNNAVILKAQGEADAILKTRKAEADGIRLVADAKLYELQKTTENFSLYVQLKQLELQKDLLQRWDGKYPVYYLGGAGAGANPNMLLQLPQVEKIPVLPTAKKDH
jgi:regulator of protease activity HflC (stomatin/prohibitin superfamily)